MSENFFSSTSKLDLSNLSISVLNRLRYFLFFSILSFNFLLLTLLVTSGKVLAAESVIFKSWGKAVRVVGSALFVGMEPQEIDQVLSDMIAQNVSVIEADSNLSNYLTESQFKQELAFMSEFTTAAHAWGLKVVWYYPSLEVITPNGNNLPNTMYKDHPDWVQLGLNGTPNVFYGGSGQAFWVEKDAESAWMSPSSPYRDYFIDRVLKIVSTGIDGLWIDIPLFADFRSRKWSDFSPSAVAKFQTDTGLSAPEVEDWNDPVWRCWIAWQLNEIALFLSDVVTAVREVNGQFPLFIKTLPTNYSGTGASSFTYDTGANQAPTAAAQSVPTTQDTVPNIALQASDPDHNSPAWTMTLQPTNGVLSGHAPNLTYTPNPGYPGADSFRSLVKDGTVHSNEATVAVTVVPASGEVIQVDGNLAEWPAGASLATDPDDISGANNGVDLLEILLANDSTNVYVAYCNDGSIVLNWGYALYLDTDQQFSTGFQFWEIGAEYVVEGSSLYRYIGKGVDWTWEFVGSPTMARSGDVLEYAFPRAWIGDPAAMNVIFHGNNAANAGGSGIDLVPSGANGSGGPRFLQYLMDHTHDLSGSGRGRPEDDQVKSVSPVPTCTVAPHFAARDGLGRLSPASTCR